MIRRRHLMFVATAAAAASPWPVFAQAWPNKPVRVVVPFPPGGPADNLARPLVLKLAEQLGQQVLIDNRGGANGNIGADAVAKAAPDGHTLLWTPTGTLAVNPSIYPKLPFDPTRDFAPVSLVAEVQGILIVNNDVPARTVAELLALARTQPGRLSFGSPGTGSIVHLLGEQLKLLAKVDLLHVPYKGVGPAMADLIGGQITMMFDSTASALAQARAGKVRMLATGATKRLAQAPELPTMAESGVPGFDSTSWHGIFAPAATPREIVLRLSQEIARALQASDVAAVFDRAGTQPLGGTPEQLAQALKAATERWGRIARDAGVKVE
jgi:tripartite-type tricarboxylate transporter receptor subunit TctC